MDGDKVNAATVPIAARQRDSSPNAAQNKKSGPFPVRISGKLVTPPEEAPEPAAAR